MDRFFSQKLIMFKALLAVIFVCVHIEQTLALTKAERKMILKVQNYFRSNVALGTAVGSNRIPLPPASNMFAFDWNRKIESFAQQAVKRCSAAHSEYFPAYGENIYHGSANLSNIKALRVILKTWWSEVKSCDHVDVSRPMQTINNCNQNFTQMAWASTNRIGCAVANCPGNLYSLRCLYSPRGNVLNEMIYSPGPKCSECPKKYWCKYGLCTTPSKKKNHQQTKSKQPKQRKDPKGRHPTETHLEGYRAHPLRLAHGLNAVERAVILKAHNEYRSLVARGEAVNKHHLPQASRMLRLSWDPELEYSAQMAADQCDRNIVNDPRENVYSTIYSTMNRSRILPTAVSVWSLHNPKCDDLDITTPLAANCDSKLSQLLWSRTNRVGCGISRCTDIGHVVICRYSPEGNRVGEMIYEIGATCSGCGDWSCTDGLCG